MRCVITFTKGQDNVKFEKNTLQKRTVRIKVFLNMELWMLNLLVGFCKCEKKSPLKPFTKLFIKQT